MVFLAPLIPEAVAAGEAAVGAGAAAGAGEAAAGAAGAGEAAAGGGGLLGMAKNIVQPLSAVHGLAHLLTGGGPQKSPQQAPISPDLVNQDQMQRRWGT